jgi:hypothetical protein
MEEGLCIYSGVPTTAKACEIDMAGFPDGIGCLVKREPTISTKVVERCSQLLGLAKYIL